MPLDFALSSIGDETVRAVSGGHEISVAIRVPRIEGERISRFVTVAEVRETYAGWGTEAYQAAHLRLRRAARDRLRDLTIQHQREVD
ncbi:MULTISPECIES: hypothetical protein [unclassified Methylobacterium]|uniref:hypothetical protein n=1 Tax=unclassified Methylobacterium TaxID=2615210 RepID=UPI0011C1E0AE|nr:MULTISPECIES: hypothetical protein [unclassified Methylobacterium]QEE39831.1 hypothetical protein FVA80_13585 [Methylobacterium sp. WL1]TXN57325.1 hypothetical protein FV241_11725 [Methylobacterium sp. WL2]